VVLVLPKNSIITADLESLKILKDEAKSVGKTLLISTENKEIKSFAKKIKISVYDAPIAASKETKIGTSKQKAVKRMMDILPPSFSPSDILPEPQLEPEEKKHEIDFGNVQETPIYEVVNNSFPEDNKSFELEKNIENFYATPKNKTPRKFKILSLKRLTFSFAAASALLLVISLYIILPKADIKISVKEIPIKTAVPVAVSKNMGSPDFVNGIIPGQYFLLYKSGSKVIEISGESDNLPLKSGGSLYIYNAYSTAPQKLVAQTRFETKDGKIFRIQSSIIVPGAKMTGNKLTPSSIKAVVVSDGTGDEYNIGPSYFTIPGFKGSPKYAGFYAESTEATVPIQNSSTIASQTIEKNKKALEDKLINELKNDTLNNFKDSDLKLIDGASTAKIDEFKTDSKNISMKITWQAIFFKEKDFKSLVDYFVSSHYPDLKNFDFKDSIAYPQATKADFKKGELFFTFNIDKDNALTADFNDLKKELAGRNETEIRTIISEKNFINSATISLWPFWVKRAPNSPEKINIILDKE
jgi:hypothetical protein